MNFITPEELEKRKKEIFKKSRQNKVHPIESNPIISEQPIATVSNMNTFRRKLDNMLGGKIESTRTPIRRNTVFEPPKRQVDRPTIISITPSIDTETQTDKMNVTMDDIYSIFNISKKQRNSCKRSTCKCIMITLGITVYTVALTTFQYYVLTK